MLDCFADLRHGLQPHPRSCAPLRAIDSRQLHERRLEEAMTAGRATGSRTCGPVPLRARTDAASLTEGPSMLRTRATLVKQPHRSSGMRESSGGWRSFVEPDFAAAS